MKYLDPKFSSRPASKAYRDNYDRVFGRGKPKPFVPDARATWRGGRIIACPPTSNEYSTQLKQAYLDAVTFTQGEMKAPMPKKPWRKR